MVSEINITNEISNQYTLKVNLPDKIWLGQSEKINIQLTKDNSQYGLINKNHVQSDFGSRKIQNLEVDFVMTGAELTPPGISITPIIEGKDIIMNWRIMPITDQDVIGTVWIYINYLSDSDNEESQRELIFTRNLSINIKNIFGLKIGLIQWGLTIFTLLNIIYLFSFFRKMNVFKGFQK
ncbi:MAG: hypothetical protein IH585_08630 [Anaerolineaceae bacterium]|nr:hypothetical protein [Anaerolineaceae bacterium]